MYRDPSEFFEKMCSLLAKSEKEILLDYYSLLCMYHITTLFLY